MASLAQNPYVGPRAFEEADHHIFFGREEETRQLTSLVIARRAVLLYAPSGAGKTSLLRAGLIPHLQQRKKLMILPVSRVGGDLHREMDGAKVKNIYVLNTLLSLADEAAEPDELVGLSLAGLSLKEGLKGYFLPPPDEDRVQPYLLILDQFEELFTTHPGRYENRADFFSQLQDSLIAYPQLGILLSMREDYIARLDPYEAQLPDRLRTRFRLELLGKEATCLAIQEPAHQSGVDFSDSAAKKLVNDLRKVRVQRPDGSVEEQPGQYVEPVQLQVVCRRLWEKLPTDARQIREEDVEAVGDVDSALAGYYDEQVAAIASETSVSEWNIREWFGQHLITEHGIRGQVLREPERSQGLNNRVIQSLVDAHLVRAERRRGATWYELIHDRFIEPIRDSNSTWKREQLWQWGKLGATVIVVVIAVVLAAMAIWASTQSQRADQITLFSQLDSQATSYLDDQFDLALLLSLEAYRTEDTWKTRSGLLTRLEHNPYLTTFLHTRTYTDVQAVFSPVSPTLLASGSADGTVTLWNLAAPHPISDTLTGHTSRVWSVAFSPDGRTLASAGADGRIILRDVATRQLISESLISHVYVHTYVHTNEVWSAAFSPDGQTLASGGADGEIILWNVATGQAIGQPLTVHTQTVRSMAFSPDGGTLASGGADGRIILWDVATHLPIREPLTEHKGEVWSVAFSPDGQTLASGSCGGFDEELDRKPCIRGEIRLWDVGNPQQPGRPLTGHTDRVTSVAFSPDSQTLASGSADRTLILWDVATRRPLGEPLTGHNTAVHSLSFNSDGQTVSSGSADGTIIQWDVTTRQRPGDPLTSHTEKVYSVAFSPDGQMLASGSQDNSIILWDVTARQPSGDPLTGHKGKVWSVAFSPDSQTLASGSQDKTIILWDLATRRPIGQPLTAHKADVYSLAFSPEGQMLASGSKDNTVILWDLATRRQIGQPFTGHADSVLSVAFSPNGQILASGSVDNTIILWDITTHQPISEPLTGHTDFVRSVAFSPDGKILSSCGYDNTIILWDVTTHQPIGEPLTGHTDKIFSLAFSPDGQTLASGSGDETIIRWDVATHQPLGKPLIGHKAAVYSVAFSPDGQMLASGSDDTNIILWDAPTRELCGQSLGQPFEGHTGSVRSVAFSPDGKTLAAGDYDDTVILWDVDTGQRLGKPLTGHRDHVYSVAFSPDGQMLASGSADGTIVLWNADTHQPLVEPLTGHPDRVWSVAFNPDGTMLASGGCGKLDPESDTRRCIQGEIRLWDLETFQAIGDPLPDPPANVYSVAFSPDGQTLVSGSADGTIILWDVAAQQPISRFLTNHTTGVASVAFSPDGQMLASGGADNTIVLWNVETLQPLGEPFVGHKADVYSVFFSPDGKTLASGSRDNTVILWDVETRRPLGQPLARHASEVWSVAFSPVSPTLASGGRDKIIILWDVSVESWQDRACYIANRNLTQSEWDQFIGSDIPYARTCPDLPLGEDASSDARHAQQGVAP